MSKMMYVLRERFARGVTGNSEADKIVVEWLDKYIKTHGGDDGRRASNQSTRG